MKKPRRLGESDAGREERLRWQAERDEHRAAHPSCQFPELVLPQSYGRFIATFDVHDHDGPIDVHHVMPRGMGGKRGATGPLVTLCRAHHDWVESHRIEAKALGLLIRRAP